MFALPISLTKRPAENKYTSICEADFQFIVGYSVGSHIPNLLMVCIHFVAGP